MTNETHNRMVRASLKEINTSLKNIGLMLFCIIVLSLMILFSASAKAGTIDGDPKFTGTWDAYEVQNDYHPRLHLTEYEEGLIIIHWSTLKHGDLFGMGYRTGGREAMFKLFSRGSEQSPWGTAEALINEHSIVWIEAFSLDGARFGRLFAPIAGEKERVSCTVYEDRK